MNWDELSRFPATIDIRRNNLDKVDLSWLSENPTAIDILRDNLDKANWHVLSANPAVIDILRKYHYKKMKENMLDLHQELVEYVYEPERLVRIARRNM